jgi:hypothetical protein
MPMPVLSFWRQKVPISEGRVHESVVERPVQQLKKCSVQEPHRQAQSSDRQISVAI